MARTLKAVFKRLSRQASHGYGSMVLFQSNREGLSVRFHADEIAAEYAVTGGSDRDEVVVLPLDALTSIAAKGGEEVRLENTRSGVQAAWNDGDVPQLKEYETFDASKLPQFPKLADSLTARDSNLLQALHLASQT